MSKIIPIGKRVLIKVIEEDAETSHGGFAVAQGARKDKPLKGEVLALGNVLELNVGDIVYFSSYGYDEVGEEVLVPAELILAVER